MTASITTAALVRGLTVDIDSTRRGHPPTRVLDSVDVELAHGTVTALIGESGCGKSMLAAALSGLLPPGSRIQGTVSIGGTSLGVDDRRWRDLRGSHVGLVPQSPATSFTPVRTFGSQLAEVIEVLGGMRTPAELCGEVGLPPAALDCYPHELSGGMAQRAAIAAAIVGEPEIIIADEPTSALDPALAQGIWELIADRADHGAAVLVITHDMDSLRAADVCTSIAVMRAGRLLVQRPPHEFSAYDSTAHAASVGTELDDYVAAFFTPVR